jgi:DUF2075 family protein
MDTIGAEIAHRSEDSCMFLLTRGIEYVYVYLDDGSETHSGLPSWRDSWMSTHKPKFLSA